MLLNLAFAVSFLGILSLLSFKAFEQQRRSKTFFSNFLSRFDGLVKRHSFSLQNQFIVLSEKLILFLKVELPRQTKYFFFLLRKNLRERYAPIALNVRGNRILRQSVNVSPFLRDISKHKENSITGRIDDVMVE